MRNPDVLRLRAVRGLRALCCLVIAVLTTYPVHWLSSQGSSHADNSSKSPASAAQIHPPFSSSSEANVPTVKGDPPGTKWDLRSVPNSNPTVRVRPAPKISDLLPRDRVTAQVTADYEFLLKKAPQLMDAQGKDLKPLQIEQWVGSTPAQQQNLKANISQIIKNMEAQVAPMEFRSQLSIFGAFGESAQPPLLPKTTGINPAYLESMRTTLAGLYKVRRVIEPGLGGRDEDPAIRAEREKILAHLIESDATIRVMLFRPCVTTKLACGGGWNYGLPTAVPPPIDWNQVAPPDPARSATVRAVGSISAMTQARPQFSLLPERKPIGTGFLVRPSVVMTNRHVVTDGDAPILAGTGRDGRELRLEGTALPEMDFFNEDCVSEPSLKAAITEVIFVHPTLDVALVRIGPLSLRTTPAAAADLAPQLEPKPLTLRRSAQMPSQNQFVAVIGYPLGCEDNPIDREQCRVIFMDDSRRGARRIAPGTIIQSANRMDPEENTVAWRHDCTTLHGSSGSPVIDLQTCQVIALHYKSETEGDPTKRVGNFAIPISELAVESRFTSGDLALNWAQ